MRNIRLLVSGRYLRTRISWTSIAVQLLMSIICSGVPSAAQKTPESDPLVRARVGQPPSALGHVSAASAATLRDVIAGRR
jgi:hypothetical protein